MKPIRIIDIEFNLLAEIDDYETMFFIRRFHGIGEIELRINRYKQHTNKLIIGNLVIVGSQLNKVFIVQHREIELDENGKETENWLIKGFALKSIIGQRITIPPSHTAYDNKSGSAESVMKHFINDNFVNPVDSNRRISQLNIAPNLQRGEYINYSSRYKNVAEEMSTLSLVSGLGWDVTIDIVNKQWIFDIVEGNSLITGQSILPPVIFSPQFESLKSLQYVQSELNYKNMAYVAGQGEGVDRRVVAIYGNSTGLKRHELFIDARDVAETIEQEGQEPIPRPEDDVINDLTNRGEQQLQEFLQEEYLEGQILTNSPFVYEKDYDLGDIVTIQNKDWGVTMDARITEIKEIYEVSGFRLEATFGNNRPTLIQKIKQELSQISGEVRK